MTEPLPFTYQSGDSRPVPDPTVLTTQQLREAETSLNRSIVERIGGLRELIEERLSGMDMATKLLAEQISKVPIDSEHARDLVRTEFQNSTTSLRELLSTRIDSIDKTTDLLARSVERVPSDIDKGVLSLHKLVEAEITSLQAVTEEKFAAIAGTFASNALALTAALAAQKEAAAEQNKSNTLAITKSEQATKETIAANASQNNAAIAALVATNQDLKDRIVRLEANVLSAPAIQALATQKELSSQRNESRLSLGSVISVVSVGVVIVVAIMNFVVR